MSNDLIREIAGLKRRVRSLEISPRLASASLEDASLPSFDRDGALKAVIGKQPDGSHTVVVLDGPTPLQPTDPTCVGGAFTVAVTWDGNLIGPFGAVDAELDTYNDFDACEIHVGATASFEPTLSTLAGTIGRLGGTQAAPSQSGTAWVRLRIRSQAGKVGPPSPAVPVEVTPLVDPAAFDQLQLDLAANIIATDEARDALAALNTTTLPALQDNLTAAQQMLDQAFPSGVLDVSAMASETIRSYVMEYAIGTSETAPPTGGWSAEAPTRTPGTYVWFRPVVTYGDGTTNTGSPALLTGNDGADGSVGADGRGIASTAVTYQVGTSGTNAPTGTWSSSIPATTAGQYLWTRTVTTYTSGAPTTAYSVAAHGQTGQTGQTGQAGADGRGIASTAIHYATSTSPTVAPTTWQTTVPVTVAGQYLWTRTTINYTSGTPSTAYSVAAHGTPGADGNDGNDGVGITGTTVAYQVGTSGTSAPTGTWSSTPVATTTAGQYLWTRTVTTYSDGSSSTAYSIAAHGAKGQTGQTGQAGLSVSSITPYYQRVTAGAAAPAQPTTNPPPSGWTATEPAFASNSEMYRTERIVFSNNTFSYTAVTKSASFAGIDAAMTAANSKNMVTYTDIADGAAIPAAPGVAGRKVGDIHRVRRSSSGAIEKEWLLNSSNNWVVVYFGDSILSSLDVGKLVAGGANIQTAVVQKMAAQVATIIELNADRITTGLLAASRIDVNSLAVAIATIIQLNADRITTGTLSADRLDANAVAAKVGSFLTLQANQIVGGQIDALIGFGTQGKFVAGDPNGAAVEIGADGISIFITDGNGARLGVPLTHWGVGENIFSITNGETADSMISLSSDGVVSSEGLSVAGDPVLAGRLLMGAWAYYRDGVADGDTDSLKWEDPWGAWGEFMDVYALAGGLTAPSGVTQFLAYGTWNLFAGRQYRYTLANAELNLTGATSSTTASGSVRAYTNWAPLGTAPPKPTGSSDVMFYKNILGPDSGSMSRLDGGFVTYGRPGSNVTQNIAIAISAMNCTAALNNTSAGYAWIFGVEDVGPRRDYGNGVAYASSAPPIVKKTYYFHPADPIAQYQGTTNATNNGYTWTYNGVRQTKKAVQGRAGWSSAAYHAMLKFGGQTSLSGSAATGVSLSSVLSGATKIETRLRLTAAYADRSSVRAKVGWASSDTATPSPQVDSARVAPGGQTTLVMPSAFNTYIAGRGNDLRISIGPGSSSSNIDGATFYGTDGTSNQRLRLQVDVWKPA